MDNFYYNLNQNKSSERKKEWMSHRKEINKLINYTKKEHPLLESVIILGAGNCDDLDLDFLENLFDSITLVDIDGDSLEYAVSQLNSSIRSEIKIIRNIDFTNLDNINFYEEFQRHLDSKISTDQILSFLKHKTIESRNYNNLLQLNHQYSIVISSAVYTQLFYIQALSIFANFTSNYTGQEVNKIVEGIRDFRNFILESYNDTLLSLIKPDGNIILWTDIIKIDSSTAFLEDTLFSLHTDDDKIKFLFESVTNYGIESAVIGLNDLTEKLDSFFMTYWIWPFNYEKKYLTIGVTGKSRSVL